MGENEMMRISPRPDHTSIRVGRGHVLKFYDDGRFTYEGGNPDEAAQEFLEALRVYVKTMRPAPLS